MKKNLTALCGICVSIAVFAQQPYYDNVNLALSGQDLFVELQFKIDNASSSFTYGDVRDAVRITDEDPNNTSNVLLVYGYDDTDGNCTTDRSRDKDGFGGSSCEYNREHVFARSLADPEMGDVNNQTTGIGADPHNLRPSDQQMNNNRGSKRFADGSGSAGNVGSGNWYPGDEWKGDVARMMMYMYTRYGDRCLPSLVGVGSTQSGTEMLQLFLQWNATDPVSALEDQRNPYLEVAYGNRNPFVDNPYLATRIWGGPAAEDRWDLYSVRDLPVLSFSVHPNPASSTVYVTTATAGNALITVHDVWGREVFTTLIQPGRGRVDVAALCSGVYFLSLLQNGGAVTRKVVVR
ncbi:MAG: endonuclease [Marinirhabdus sp.]